MKRLNKPCKWAKIDRYVISKQTWEREWVKIKMAHEGIQVRHQQVDQAVKLCGRSRQKVYNYLRKTYKDQVI